MQISQTLFYGWLHLGNLLVDNIGAPINVCTQLKIKETRLSQLNRKQKRNGERKYTYNHWEV